VRPARPEAGSPLLLARRDLDQLPLELYVPTTIRIKRRDGSVVHAARDVLALTGLLHGRAGLRAEEIRSP
jgi:hypothetical protein